MLRVTIGLRNQQCSFKMILESKDMSQEPKKMSDPPDVSHVSVGGGDKGE